eukprot:1013555-Rhodomonas_salina.1
MDFDAFVSALGSIAEKLYGVSDSVARLVYFKIVRFGKSTAQVRVAPYTPTPHLVLNYCIALATSGTNVLYGATRLLYRTLQICYAPTGGYSSSHRQPRGDVLLSYANCTARRACTVGATGTSRAYCLVVGPVLMEGTGTSRAHCVVVGPVLMDGTGTSRASYISSGETLQSQQQQQQP